MAEGWIEPRTRVPFVGIIAMVIIVAIVAIFIKTQLAPLFPASEVTVEAGNDRNTAGSASASFYGLREIPLKPKEYLQGTIGTPAGSTRLLIDVPTMAMTLSRGERREEVLLRQDGERLFAEFEQDGILTRVDIDAAGRQMLLSQPGKSVEPVQIALGDIKMYRGIFTVRNQQYLFQFSPAGGYATISAAKATTVALTQDGTTYRGEWIEAGKSHPVSIDMDEQLAVIEDVY